MAVADRLASLRTATPFDVIDGRASAAVHEGCGFAMMQSLPSASAAAVIDDVPYGVDIAGWDTEMPPQSWLDESLRVSAGPVVWFGSASKTLDFSSYSPRPDRILIWAPSFSLSRASSHSMLYRYQPIMVWRPGMTGSALFCDVLRHPTEGHNPWNHPCLKPLALMRDLVLGFAPEGGVVVDFTAGAGTTGVAAMTTNKHRVILAENVPEHAETCRVRLAGVEPGRDWQEPSQGLLFGEEAMSKPRRGRAPRRGPKPAKVTP